MRTDQRWYKPARWVSFAIRSYQRTISTRTGSNCRYLPTCSSYALEAVEMHGATRGVWLSVKRITRCNPWATDGFEHWPVPPKKDPSHA